MIILFFFGEELGGRKMQTNLHKLDYNFIYTYLSTE